MSLPSRVPLLLALLLSLLAAGHAQEAEEAAAPAKKGTVRITFLPPPMEGTLSLGIYDKAGKLVRVLASEAAENDFAIGLNGLITAWDGRDDAGRPAPAGTYSARGFSVGAIAVDGVAYHGNDWMLDDESPSIRRVLSLELRKSGRLAIWAEGADGQKRLVRCDQAGEFAGEIPPDPQVSALALGQEAAETEPASPLAHASVADGKVTLREGGKTQVLDLPELTKPLDASLGRDSVWVIDEVHGQTEVKEYRLDGELRRRLAIDPAEPVPRRIFASRTSDLIFLVEEKPGVQRVRGLALDSPAGGDATPATSTWKTVLEKSIFASDHFAAVAGRLGRILPFLPRDKFTVRLLPNPLLRGALTTASVTIGFDAHGSFLKTTDGLPLRRITEAPFLKWAVIGEEGSGRQLTIFQGDGAVVEEFKARKLANMMAFDAGEFEWPPAK